MRRRLRSTRTAGLWANSCALPLRAVDVQGGAAHPIPSGREPLSICPPGVYFLRLPVRCHCSNWITCTARASVSPEIAVARTGFSACSGARKPRVMVLDPFPVKVSPLEEASVLYCTVLGSCSVHECSLSGQLSLASRCPRAAVANG